MVQNTGEVAVPHAASEPHHSLLRRDRLPQRALVAVVQVKSVALVERLSERRRVFDVARGCVPELDAIRPARGRLTGRVTLGRAEPVIDGQ